jgi:hypothetical protein
MLNGVGRLPAAKTKTERRCYDDAAEAGLEAMLQRPNSILIMGSSTFIVIAAASALPAAHHLSLLLDHVATAAQPGPA